MTQIGRESGGISSGAIPRRAAAERASRLAAEQLESSPIPQSDTDRDGGVMFGEPSTPKTTVRVTYGAKRKYKDTPPRSGVASDAGSSMSRPQSLVEYSPNKLPTNDGPSSGRGGRGQNGRSSQARSTLPSSSIENRALSLSEPEIMSLDDGSDYPVKPLPRRNTVGATDNRNIDSMAPKSGNANGKGPRKRALSLSSPREAARPTRNTCCRTAVDMLIPSVVPSDRNRYEHAMAIAESAGVVLAIIAMSVLVIADW